MVFIGPGRHPLYYPYWQYAGAEQRRGPLYDNYGYQEELASRLHRDWPNGQKQLYVSQTPLYDSWSSMPGEDSSSSSTSCKRCLIIFGIILLMCGIITGIVLAIYFSQRDAYEQIPGTSVAPTPTTPGSQPLLKEYIVTLTTEGNYTPALNDSSSKEFKEKAESFQNRMDAIYKNSSLAGSYNGTKVLGFRKLSPGSVLVYFQISLIIIPSSPTPAAINVTSSPSISDSTQKTTTKIPDLDMISKSVMKALNDIINENAIILELDMTKNNSIQIIEITTTARPTTTPIRTTPMTTVSSTSQRPDTTKTHLPSSIPTTIKEMVTESMPPKTGSPNLPYTEPSKPETSKELASNEPEQSTSVQKVVPESTKPPTQFTTAPFNTNAPASQTTFTPVTTESDVPTLGERTLIQDITTVTQAESKLTTTKELPTQDITDLFTPAQNSTYKKEVNFTTTPGSTKASINFSSNYTVVTLPFSTSITPIENQTSESEIMYTGTTINPLMTTTTSFKEPDDCNPRLSSCENGQCIRHEWFCDNHVDCLDASDEDNVRCGRNTTKRPKPTGNELDCNFESHAKELCNYEASPGAYNWRVKRGSTSSNNTGPDFDHTYMNSKGHFLFTESSYGKYNDNATLKSIPVATDNISHSLTFYYHMNGAHMGSLVVYFNILTLNGLQRVLKWRESGNHGNMWLKACVEMPKETKLSVEFVAYRGLNYTSDIAIDDIKYSTDSCISVSCTYEESNCGHIMPNFENKTNSNSYAWRRVRGKVMMGKSRAPKTDFTQGMQYGAFLIADSKFGNTGDKAIFHTPLIKTSKTMALNFRLYISGTSVGKIQVSLLSQLNSVSTLTYQRSSITQGWERICMLVPKDFVGIAEFVAEHGDGISGYIAIDDVALGPETVCNGFSTCQFESGIYCNFNITGKDYRWRRYNALKGHYLIASGEGAEGSNSTLVTPKFTPLYNSSISMRYAIQGTSILSVWIKEYMNGNQVKKKLWSTEGLMTGVQTTPSMPEKINFQANYLIQNTNKRMDWLTACINLPKDNEVSIEIVSRKLDPNGGEVALDWVNVNMKQCQISLDYNTCNFDEPNLCGYEIDCPYNTQYKWKRIAGSTPTSATGPLRDHTFNNTIGHYLYTEGSVGRAGDKAIVTFMNIQTTINTSIRFYYYMSGRDIGALYLIVGNKAGKISWIQEGNKPPIWYYGCVDLPSNKKVNVSFIGIHGNGPLSDIAIDDVYLSYDRCPARHISCNFENEMICGYTGVPEYKMRTEKSFDEQWVRLNGSSAILPQLDHTLNSSQGHFLATSHPSKIMSPRIAYGQTMCLQFYYYIQLGKGQAISVTADYEDTKKNKVKIFGTNGFSLARWRHGQMNLSPGNISVIFSVGQYNQEISSTIFAFDDVSITYGMCPETVCSEQMFKCKQDDICIPDYKKCDQVQDCSDGADELNCPANRSNIRLVDGTTSGDKGRVEIYVNGSWGTAYSLRWFESNAKVACRQLGYTGFSKSIRFGKYFFGLGNVWQITCIGNETSLQDCDKVNVVNTISHLYDVGLACYNSACEPGKKACPKIVHSSVVYCLDSSQFCDGDIDCPGKEDEKNCSNCQANEFTCKNHVCILKTKRCDGKPDCLDASDEMNCVRRDDESNVEIYYNDNWTSLCANGTNEALYSSLCLIMGQGVVKRKTVDSSNSVGLIPTPNPSKMTAIGKYDLSLSSKACPKLKLECYGQECGRRSQKKFDPFVQYGNQAVPMEYPWQAMLLRNGNFHCGASIFNSRWIITAEHCVVEKYVRYEVVAGLLLIQDLDKYPKIKVIDIIHSMNYASHKGIPINDIALILLEKDLVFNDYIQPVCLPSKVYTEQDYCYLSGWGRNENLVGQSHLKETRVYAVSNEVCKEYYDNVTDNSFICFRHNKPNMPSCYGDSGGPLVCRNDRGRFELVGVVSFGLPLCAATNRTPAAFTNVLNFRGWIVDQTRCRMWCPNKKCLYKAETCDGIDHCSDRSDESHPTCNPTVTCHFDKPYKCGYRNDSSNTWYWSGPHWSVPYMKAKPMIGRDTETEKYMLASINATKLFPAKMISPKATEIPCISFKYMANASNTATAVLILKVLQQNSLSYKKIWNTSKNDTHEMIIWKLTTVSLPSMTKSIMFEAYYENPNEYSFIAIDSINVLDQNCTVCHSTEFQCNTGQCINAKYVCDRILHCSDGSDELNCLKTTPPASCSSDHFQCSNGKCILKDEKCNGIEDCTDGSDENQCTKPPGPCSWDQFHCNDGQCIEDYLKCDGFWHCKDGSDEKNCHKTTVVPPGICKWNQFRCNNGQCIDFHLKCDNIKQCKDGSDEQYCGEKTTVQPGRCTWDQFRCDNGQCIQAFLRCDRQWHCKDGSDEQNCLVSIPKKEYQCRWDQFRCSDGYCIQRNKRCDGIWHCVDGSDEDFCFSPSTDSPGPCLQSQFRCNNGQCIESFLKCDKVRHCKDGTDEQNCGATTIRPQGICRWDQFQCNDGQCIQYYLKCDQIWHCRDGSDEQNCPKPLIKKSGCKYNEFRCIDGKCIEIILVCNQNKDCSDGEDEYNCTNTTQATITKTESSSTATKRHLITANLPYVTKMIIFPGRSSIIPLVTATPIQHGTSTNIPFVTAVPIHHGTRINIPLVTATPIERGTKIIIPLITALPIHRGTTINIPLVTALPIHRGTKINVPLVTAVPIHHGTKVNIPLVTLAPNQRGTKVNIPLVTALPIHHITKINIPLVRVGPVHHSTRINIPLVTAVPIHHSTKINITPVTVGSIQHGTRISIPLVTAVTIHRGTRINIPHVTALPIHRATRISIPLVTAVPIHHGTRINIPHVTALPIHRATRINIPLVTALPIHRGTRISIPSVTTVPIHHGTRISIPPVTALPIHRGTRISIPSVTTVPIHHGTRINIPPVTVGPIQRRTKISIPSVTALPIHHGTRISIPSVTTVPIHRSTRINIPFVTVGPIHRGTRISIPPVTAVLIHHGTRINIPPVTASPILHSTKINISHVTASSILSHKTEFLNFTITPFYSKSVLSSRVTDVTSGHGTKINVPSIKIHSSHRSNLQPVTVPPTPHHTMTFLPVTVTPSHHDIIRSTTIPLQRSMAVTRSYRRTNLPPTSMKAVEHNTKINIPYATAIPSLHKTDNSYVTTTSPHHIKISFPHLTTISTDHVTKNTPFHVTATSTPPYKIPHLDATTIVGHQKKISTPHVRQTSTAHHQNVLPHLKTTAKLLVTPWIFPSVTPRSNQHVTSSVRTLFSTTTQACAANEFRCDERQCIPEAFVCDVIPDCDNAQDELNCDDLTTTVRTTETNACFPNEFKCDENQCIPKLFVCDVIPDCDNRRDELECDETTTTLEKLLPGICQSNEFLCSNGQCILKSKRCDKMLDCSDNSDEENCSTTTASTKKENITGSRLTTIKPTREGCALDQFQCNSGSCIPISRYCNTVLDCPDGSDEICHTSTQKSTLKGCSYDDFRCDNGQCIPLSFHCDTLFDCNDRSDEKNCSHVTPTLPSIQGCGADEFHCKNGYCIELAFVCDGLFDCPDSSDEEDCPVTKPTESTTTTEFKICTKSEYQCPSGKCINADYVCDGIPDCSSADDEASCKVSTSRPESSIPASDKCFPLEVKECLQVGYSRSLLPNVFGDKSYTQAMERFYMEAMPIIARQCSKKALMLFCGTIFPLCKDGISKYTCKSVCREVEQSCGKDSILMDTCDWLVDDSRWCFIGLTENEKLQGNTTNKSPLYPKVQGCLKGFYQCKNSSLCLHPIHLCDGEPTCPQADDEPENCTCLSNQFRCASGQCVMKSRRCNGYQDCKDYSDERNCSVTECVGRLCNSGQCVPSESFCDGFFDCDDLSDEKLCECKPPHRRCNNQVCITPDKWCNREDNCGDNSDEKNCDCSTGELMCSDGRCIPLEWWCDGNRDCADGKDESHCHNCKSDEFICTRGYKCIKRAKVCDMKWDCVDGEDEATCVSLRKEESLKNSTAILTLTVQGQTSMVCSNKWSMKWASFICKYLRHKNVKKVEFVDPPPGTTAFQQVPSHELEYPEQEFIKTTRTCKTNKIVRMACNERSCGTNRHHSIKYQEYIIGGDLARRYTWPWSVSLLYLGEPMCGATLISERWLVTAAHCIVTGMWNRTKVPHYFSAVLGEVDLFKGLMNGTRIPIDKIIFPEDMKLVVFNPDPDIALLRLKDSIQPNYQIEPICMPKLPKHGPGSTCYLAGWGGAHKPGEGRRRYSNFLHEVRMIIRNTSECSTFRPQPNWEHNLCAGYLESTITGCYGDSGGGLMCWEPDNHWTLVGVLSKGRYNCAANSPNVFTKIGSMRQWIEESMGWTSEDSG